MNIIKLLFQLVAVIYLANYLSSYAVKETNIILIIYTFLCLIGFVLFLLSSWRFKLALFALITFIPLTFSFNLPFGTVEMFLAPILLVLSLFEVIKNGQTLFSKKASIYFIAIGVLALWGIIHYILNPVLGQLTFGIGLESGGLKNYYFLISGICTFFCSYLFFKNNQFAIEKYFIFLIILCSVLGYLFIMGIFTDVPVLNFFKLGTYAMEQKAKYFKGYQYSSIPLRNISALGLALMFSIFHNKKWGVLFIFIFVQMVVFIIFGGGRSSLPLFCLVLTSYIAFINRRYLFPVLSVVLILSSLYVLTLSNVNLSELKFGRAFKIQGGLAEQDDSRYYSFLYMFNTFEKSPLLGKGIGYKELTADDEFFRKYPEAVNHIDYIKLQAMTGGHGTYMSILSVFGLGGFFWLMVFLLGGIFHSYRYFNINDGLDDNAAKIALFVFLELLAMSIGYYVGGGGAYDDMKFWFLAGIIAGLISRDEGTREHELSDSCINQPKVISSPI